VLYSISLPNAAIHIAALSPLAECCSSIPAIPATEGNEWQRNYHNFLNEAHESFSFMRVHTSPARPIAGDSFVVSTTISGVSGPARTQVVAKNGCPVSQSPGRTLPFYPEVPSYSIRNYLCIQTSLDQFPSAGAEPIDFVHWDPDLDDSPDPARRGMQSLNYFHPH